MAITNARMQQKRGEEVNFDPDKMLPGEWAVSLDTKYVRMCFSPGVCVRMATYEAFEADMAQIQKILEECQTIEDAVKLINSQVSEKLQATIEYTNQAKQYRNEAEESATNAYASANNAKSSEDKAKVSETNAKASETNAKISEENAQRVAESLPEDYTELSKAFYNTAIKQKAVGDNIHVTDSANGKNVGFGLYGKAEQNGEPTPDNPIEITVSGSDGSVEVVSCGKNLLENTATTQTVNGVTFTVNDDGSITVNGTATNNATLAIRFSDLSLVAGSYKYTCLIKAGDTTTFRSWVSVNNANYIDIGSGANFTIDNDISDVYVGLSVYSGYTANNLTFYPMIRLASDTDSTYQPYTETTSTIPTPNGLCGIKVSSGGNYTDENGQQWICDEIVKYADGSGKRIQRIGKDVFDGSDDEGWKESKANVTRFGTHIVANSVLRPTVPSVRANILCNQFIPKSANNTYSGIQGISVEINGSITVYAENITTLEEWTAYLAENPMILYYELATPIITDLTAEEIAEIEKLHTFYPVTNISNDADCGMSVTYLCDAKNYIDNRLALIETALVNSI